MKLCCFDVIKVLWAGYAVRDDTKVWSSSAVVLSVGPSSKNGNLQGKLHLLWLHRVAFSTGYSASSLGSRLTYN